MPEALTGGDATEDTLVQAAERVAEIPTPSRVKRGQHPVSVPLYLAPKLAFYLATRELGMRKTDLAKRLSVSETLVRRMLDPAHDTKPEKIQAALAALGNRIVVRFEYAA